MDGPKMDWLLVAREWHDHNHGLEDNLKEEQRLTEIQLRVPRLLVELLPDQQMNHPTKLLIPAPLNLEAMLRENPTRSIGFVLV